MRPGEVDWTGQISKCGDAMLRSYLFEAARGSADARPKMVIREGLGVRLAKRNGLRKGQRLRSRVNSRSFCIACGSTGLSSTGRRRRLLL